MNKCKVVKEVVAMKGGQQQPIPGAKEGSGMQASVAAAGFSSCGTWALERAGFSGFGGLAQYLWLSGLISCPMVYVIFPDKG